VSALHEFGIDFGADRASWGIVVRSFCGRFRKRRQLVRLAERHNESLFELRITRARGLVSPAAIPTHRILLAATLSTARALTTHCAREVMRGKKLEKKCRLGPRKGAPVEHPGRSRWQAHAFTPDWKVKFDRDGNGDQAAF